MPTGVLPFLIALAFSALCVVGAAIYWAMEVWAEKNYRLGEVSTDKVVFADLWKFGVSYWLIVALCIVFYSAIFPFQTFAVKFFMEAHGTSREFGGFLSSMLTLFAMIATPLFGLWVDRVGKRALLMMLGSLLLIPVYLMMAYTRVNLYVPMAMMGVAFSLIPAVMWPSVAYIVDQSKLGTAYGLMTMIQNIGLFGLNMLVGWANENGHADACQPRRLQPRACGCSRSWDSLECSSPSCFASGNWGRTDMDWRPSPPAKSDILGVAENLPISEDRNSKFGIGFIVRDSTAFKSEQGKDFWRQSSSSKNPKIGRTALIF